MNMKIIIFVLFIGLLINPVLCDTGIFEWSGSDTRNYYMESASKANVEWSINYIYIYDADEMHSLDYIMMRCDMPSNIPEPQSYWMPVTYKIGAVVVGTGTYGYLKNSDDSVTIAAFMNSDYDTSAFDGIQHVSIIGDIPTIINSIAHDSYFVWVPAEDIAFFEYVPDGRVYNDPDGIDIMTKATYSSSNQYNYTSNNNILYFQLDRQPENKLQVKIDSEYKEIINETQLYDEPLEIYDIDIINSTWSIYAINSFGDYNTHEIYFYPSSYQPTLTTDKTYYNTSEVIEISYTNIDVIYDECTSSLCYESYQLWIYALNTPNIPKFRQWLYSDRRDETFTLNTSILSPQTEYQLMITSGESNIVISSDIFYVYPDDEYLSVSCDADANCITYNGIKNTIYYKINNNSNIIIKDNDNNIINTYYNIIGTGSIIYTIPDDLEHLNTYPNWKVYLNNTGYSTSFNKDIIVYWSQFQTPTPTPTYTPKPTPDINISDTIDEFKTETQPIKDLIFGLSEIVIDNPDYNEDNIVNESELNHWFNSLIPICIIFLLIVLYIGLKKNRND